MIELFSVHPEDLRAWVSLNIMKSNRLPSKSDDLKMYNHILESTPCAMSKKTPVIGCPGRNFYALCLLERDTIEEHSLSWEAVFSWAKLISDGTVAYCEGALPDQVLAQRIDSDLNDSGASAAIEIDSEEEDSATLEGLAREGAAAKVGRRFTWSAPMDSVLLQQKSITSSSAAPKASQPTKVDLQRQLLPTLLAATNDMSVRSKVLINIVKASTDVLESLTMMKAFIDQGILSPEELLNTAMALFEQ